MYIYMYIYIYIYVSWEIFVYRHISTATLTGHVRIESNQAESNTKSDGSGARTHTQKTGVRECLG